MTVIILDGNNAMFRYGWVHRHLMTHDGRKTGAVYGVLNLLLRLKRKYPRAKFITAWDGPSARRGWRYKLFEGYKSKRKELSPEAVEVFKQIQILENMMTMLGIPQVKVSEVEADDIIGILCERCRCRGWESIVYSSDQDFLQLMASGVKLIRDVDKQDKLSFESAEFVQKKFRCSVENVLKVRAVAGDLSDCIPGIKQGVGPVRAAAMIEEGYDLFSTSEGARNYQLMKIVQSESFDLFTTEQRDALKASVETAITSLTKAPSICSTWDLLEFLKDLDMVDAISRRKEIVMLQLVDRHAKNFSVEKRQ